MIEKKIEEMSIYLRKVSKHVYYKPLKFKKLIVGDALAILPPMIFVLFIYLSLYEESDIRATPFTTNKLNPFGFITPILWLFLMVKVFSPYFHALFGRDIPKKNGIIILYLFPLVAITDFQHHKYFEYSYFALTGYSKIMLVQFEKEQILI